MQFNEHVPKQADFEGKDPDQGPDAIRDFHTWLCFSVSIIKQSPSAPD
jgi:hypothetical protein